MAIVGSLPARGHSRVLNGRLVLDEPSDLPDGTEVDLVPADDDLDDADRARLHAAIARGIAEYRRGESIPAADFLAALRAGR